MGNESGNTQDGAFDPPVSTEGGGGDVPASSTKRWRKRVTRLALVLVIVSAAVVLPPLVNIGRYQRQITNLMSRSMGRPVRLSGVEMRLLPTPAFVLHDLSVSEDPNFGAEPILFARTVVASVRLFSLWRGKLEVSRVSVDEASLNLVRMPQGRWNLESVMMGAASGPQPAGQPGPAGPSLAVAKPFSFPYLEATNSRVNLKNGTEKSPFSIVDTDLSLWQDEPGAWRVRLRGQPVRTDMEMSLADTGELRMEASLHTAPQLREMPLKLQMEWRDAQLGQLSRLLLGSDAGWRGDLTADIDVQGTPDSAQTTARLRTTSVRRQEFAPETPLDFDANCKFRYQHSANAFHDVNCDTSIGGGRLQLKAEVPGNAGPPEAKLDVKQVALQAALDLLRTLRSGFAPGVAVKGTASGSLTYKVPTSDVPAPASGRGSHRATAAKAPVAGLAPTNLQGSLTVVGASLSGGELTDPLTLPAMTWTPATVPASGSDVTKTAARLGLETRFVVDMPASRNQPRQASARRSSPDAKPDAKATDSPAAPLSAAARSIAIRLALSPHGYNGSVSGSAETAKLRELAYAFGFPHQDVLDQFEGGSVSFDLEGAGPWVESAEPGISNQPDASLTSNHATASNEPVPEAATGTDSVTGSLHVASITWKPTFLAAPANLTQGTLTIKGKESLFNADFSYGDIAGSAVVHATPLCKLTACSPQVSLRFGALDAAVVQRALLGAPAQKSLLSPLIDQFAQLNKSGSSSWPDVQLNVQAESLALGPVVLHKPDLNIEVNAGEVHLTNWEAGVLAGSVHGTGSFAVEKTGPTYAVDGEFANVNTTQLGAMFGSRWSGGPMSGTGSVKLSGLTGKQLSASAQGDVTFNWQHGSVTLDQSATHRASRPVPATRFDQWSGKVSIKGGKAILGENTLVSARQKTSATGEIPFDAPAKLVIPAPVQ